MPFSESTNRPADSSSPQKKKEEERPSAWRIWRRRLLVLMLVALVVVAGGLYSTYQATQQAPDFYEEIVKQPPLTTSAAPPIQEAAEEQLQQVEEAAKQKANWQFEFTQDQINAYLANDFPEQFPGWLPSFLKDPRIKIDAGKVLLGCQYDSPRFKAVVWLEAEAGVSEDGKSIKLIPKSAGAGLLPMPLSRLFERLDDLERYNQGDLTIDLIEEPPQAILLGLRREALPEERCGYVIDAITLEPGKLMITGSWEDAPESKEVSEEDAD